MNFNPLETIQDRQDLFRFIQPQDIKTLCNMGSNVVDEELIPNIVLSQDTKIQTVLGKTLYNELVAEFIAANYNPALLPDGTTLPNQINYQELYQEIYKPLVWWSYYNSLAPIAIKIEEKGVQLNDSDYSDNAGIIGLKEVEARARKYAEHYQELLFCYINETFKDRTLPTYRTELVKESREEGKRFSGIYFPHQRGCVKCNTDCKR
jgi:hypothetical protein